MKEISPSDLLEVRPQSLFSTQDYTYLLDFYAPIIGVKSVGVFFALINVEAGEILSHKAFFTKNQLSSGEFIAALAGLEAMGLVQTFKKVEEEYQLYCYCTYSPRTPKEFLGNELLAGTLIKYIGEQALDKLAKKYQVEETPNDFENVSETFREYFSIDFSDPVYSKQAKQSGGRVLGSINTGFDKNAFVKALKELDPRFGLKSFTTDEFVRIARIAALYDYSEEAIASFVRESYGFSRKPGEKMNFGYLAKMAEDNYRFSYLHKTPARSSQAHGDSPLAGMIRKMENTSPVEFLSRMQKGNKPAKSDLDLINTLVVEMGLSKPVCNALLFYLLTTENGVLSNSRAQKLASVLVRQGVDTVIDALNYFSEDRKRIQSAKDYAEKQEKKKISYAKPFQENVPAPIQSPIKQEKTSKQSQMDTASKNIEEDNSQDLTSFEELEDFLNNVKIED